MGKADEYQFDYLENNYRFADLVNGALFNGRQIINPDELEPADTQIVYLVQEAGTRKIYAGHYLSGILWYRASMECANAVTMSSVSCE